MISFWWKHLHLIDFAFVMVPIVPMCLVPSVPVLVAGVISIVYTIMTQRTGMLYYVMCKEYEEVVHELATGLKEYRMQELISGRDSTTDSPVQQERDKQEPNSNEE